MKRDKQGPVSLSPLSALALVGAVLCGCFPALAQNTITPSAITITNGSPTAVYANLVIGLPPVCIPTHKHPCPCTNVGHWIQSITDPNLVFVSSIPSKTVTFTPWTPGVTVNGYYLLAAGETITYQPQTFQCGAGTCSPLFQSTFFFASSPYDGNPNNGCGGSTVFPNATNVGEITVNAALNGSQGSCADADAADISAVNGINSLLTLSLTGASWSISSAANGGFGTNADKLGVYGWAATGCVNDTGYPNPRSQCAAPTNAPVAPASGQCTTPGGTQYSPIAFEGTNYCPELSDSSTAYPQGQCVSQRPGGVTGGVAALTFNSFYNPSVSEKKPVAKKKGPAH